MKFFPLGLLFSATLSWGLGNETLLNDPGQEQEPRVDLTRAADRANRRLQANLRHDVKVVLVPVTVTDALDRPITDLTRDRFRVLEDGIEQKISFFFSEDAPVSLGLLFDSSGSMKNRIDTSVIALKEFFQTTIPGDEFFVI